MINHKKLIYPMIILGSFILLSCASVSRVEEISSTVRDLNTKFDQINDHVNDLRPEIEHIKDEAIRANKRLDNQSVFYTK